MYVFKTNMSIERGMAAQPNQIMFKKAPLNDSCNERCRRKE